jgi:NitT/TauT family transport system permease protein
MEYTRIGRAPGGTIARRRSFVFTRRSRETRRTIGGEVRTALLSILVCTVLVYLVWEAVCLAGTLSTIVLPTPLQVLDTFRAELASGDLQSNAWVTLYEALGGFVLAQVVAATLGYAIAHVRWLELLIAPFIAAMQGVPAIAVAPIIVLLLGGGLWPKAIVAAAVVVFPLLTTTVTGLRGIEREYRDVARVFGASRLQMLRHVELPLAAPVLLSGLKIGLTLSITGAVVGEFVASDAGLGFMVNTSISTFEVSTRYVAVITLAVLSGSMFGIVTLLERIAQRWLDA